MKTKQLIIIVLMIIVVIMLGTKAEATENTQVETNQNEEIKIENIEKGKQYNLTKDVKTKTLPLIFAIEKENIPSGNIRIIDILNDWCKIENSEISGWIRINTIKNAIEQEKNEENPNKEEPDENQQPEDNNQNNEENKTEEITEISKIGYVKADGLNIRKEPTTSSEIVHSLSFNSKIKITGEIDGWYRINYNNQEAYVSQKYISDTKLPETTTRGGYDRENTIENSVSEETIENEQNDVEIEENIESGIENSTSSEGNEIVEFAKQYLGYKYVSGGASPETGFDCSGFTTYVFRNFGISLNRTSKDQIKNGVAVGKSDLQPGDLVIFKNRGKTAIGHVGIYIGDGEFIHSANQKEGVVITALSSSYYAQRYVGARRVI